MDKEQVIQKLSFFYEEEMKENHFYQQSKENQELAIKLLQTTGLIVKSFDYEFPVGYTFKGKLANVVRRVIRRSIHFITKPYADKMYKYNESMCELIAQIIKQYGDKIYVLSQQNKMLQQEIKACNNKINEMALK